MELREYLKEKEISSAKFSKKIDVLEATVLKWRYANVIPRKNDMHKIYKCTNGLVTPNDFYLIDKSRKSELTEKDFKNLDLALDVFKNTRTKENKKEYKSMFETFVKVYNNLLGINQNGKTIRY